MDYSKNKTGVTEWHHDATMKVLRMFFTLKSMIFLRNDDFLTRKSKKTKLFIGRWRCSEESEYGLHGLFAHMGVGDGLKGEAHRYDPGATAA